MNPHLKAALWLLATTIGAAVFVAQGRDWSALGPNDIRDIVCAGAANFAITGAGLWNMLGTKPPEKPNA